MFISGFDIIVRVGIAFVVTDFVKVVESLNDIVNISIAIIWETFVLQSLGKP